MSYFLVTTLASKLWEAYKFVKKEQLLENVPENAPPKLMKAGDRFNRFYENRQVSIFGFIRNKFGFHYDTYNDLDPKIDTAFRKRSRIDMWLGEENHGNDIFSSTNDIISEVLYDQMQTYGFCGDREQFVNCLCNLVLDGVEVVQKWTRFYLYYCFPGWKETDKAELEAPIESEVVLPTIIARDGSV